MLRFINERGVHYDPSTHPEVISLNANGRTTFGRRRDNDVCLDSLRPQLISRVHAYITGDADAIAGAFTLTSVGMNGVSVNGARVRSTVGLAIGDEIVFGADKSLSELVYVMESLTSSAAQRTAVCGAPPSSPASSPALALALTAPTAHTPTAPVVLAGQDVASPPPPTTPFRPPVAATAASGFCPVASAVTRPAATRPAVTRPAVTRPAAAESTAAPTGGRVGNADTHIAHPACSITATVTGASYPAASSFTAPTAVTIHADVDPEEPIASSSAALLSSSGRQAVAVELVLDSPPPAAAVMAVTSSRHDESDDDIILLEVEPPPSSLSSSRSPPPSASVDASPSLGMFAGVQVVTETQAATTTASASTVAEVTPGSGCMAGGVRAHAMAALMAGSLSPIRIPRPPGKRRHEEREAWGDFVSLEHSDPLEDGVTFVGEVASQTGKGATSTTAMVAKATTKVPAEAHAVAAGPAVEPTVPAWLDDINEELLCCICRELMVHATALPCSHTFCKPCLSDWLKKNKTCPNCRSAASLASGIRVKALDNTIDHLARRVLPEDEQVERQERIAKLAEREKAAAGAPGANKRVNARVTPLPGPAFIDLDDDSDDSDVLDDSDDEDEDEDNDAHSLELAASGRSQCRHCHQLIQNQSLRWRRQVRRGHYDTVEFYHVECRVPAAATLMTAAALRGLSTEDRIRVRDVYRRMGH